MFNEQAKSLLLSTKVFLVDSCESIIEAETV